MSEANFAPTETTRTDAQIGLVFEDQRSGDLRKVIYVDDHVVLVRDETGSTTLTPRDSFESQLGNRYRVRRGVDPAVDAGQYDRLRDALAEYEAAEGRKAAHKAEALDEALDLVAGRTPDGEEDADAESDDDGDDATDEEFPFEDVPGIGPETAGKLRTQGFVTVSDVRGASDDALLAVSGVGPSALENVREFAEEFDS
ncbi:helix-hairpin-helix domain-containing protein [Halomicrobium salinisoli]|uniref:helix-hairpin-helix domain-containing protein n=1 Tax=Halomicrobium salinisoli TaxID=2878391 RepID=UPI001CF0B874|nr:helix-hairpin-helix domain-containing protein [Halomicrobium salinisoli]